MNYAEYVVPISNRDALLKVVADMREEASRDIVEDAPHYCENIEELGAAVKRCEEEDALRFTRYFMTKASVLDVEDDSVVRIFSVVFTRDHYEDVDRWHLSICSQMEDATQPMGVRTERVSNAMSKYIAEALFGEDYQEIEREGKVILEVRHFEQRCS